MARLNKQWIAQRFKDGTITVLAYDRNDAIEVMYDQSADDTWGPYEADSYEDALAEAEQVLGDGI